MPPPRRRILLHQGRWILFNQQMTGLISPRGNPGSQRPGVRAVRRWGRKCYCPVKGAGQTRDRAR